MMRVGRVCLVILFVLPILTGCVARSDFEKVQSDLVASQSQYQTSQSDYSKLKTEHEGLSGDYETLKAQHEKLQNDFDALNKDKQALEEQLKAAQAKLSTAELGRRSAEASLKVTRERVAKAKIEAGILDLIFSPLWGAYRKLMTNSQASDIREMLDKMVADANDQKLTEKYAALSDSPNNTEATLDFLVYLISDLANQLR